MPNFWTAPWTIATTNNITTHTYFTTATTPGRGTPDMPITRDSRGRFASTREKTPVTTVEEAADTMRHFTQLMNSIADEHRLCSQFGISVTRAVADTPGIDWDTPNAPEFEGAFTIRGTVRTPTGARIVGPNGDSRGEAARRLIDSEFEAWCRGHELDHTRGSSFMAWYDSLPDDRKSISGGGGGRRHVQTGLDAYFSPTATGRRLVTFVTSAPEATEALPLDPAVPAKDATDRATFEIGDRVQVLASAAVDGANGHYGRAFGGGDYRFPLAAEVTGHARQEGFYTVRADGGSGWGATQTVEGIHLRHAAEAAANPEPQTYATGDYVRVLPTASQRGSATDRRYSSAFNRRDHGHALYGVVTGLASGGEGYLVRSISPGDYRVLQSVATEDLRPASRDDIPPDDLPLADLERGAIPATPF